MNPLRCFCLNQCLRSNAIISLIIRTGRAEILSLVEAHFVVCIYTTEDVLHVVAIRVAPNKLVDDHRDFCGIVECKLPSWWIVFLEGFDGDHRNESISGS